MGGTFLNRNESLIRNHSKHGCPKEILNIELINKILALRYLELIGSLPTSSFFYTISIFERAKRTLHFLLVHCPDQRIENRSLCNVPYK